MIENLKELLKYIETKKTKVVSSSRFHLDQLFLAVEKTSLIKLLTFLRDDAQLQFKQLIDICGVDYPQRPDRFEVVYQLLSLRANLRLTIKITAQEGEVVPSVAHLFGAANWYEREAFDLFGIPFEGHPDLRRILTDYNFQGYPLRKDFPLTGYVEPRYDDELQRVVYDNVQLPQEFRNFDFLSPWEGMTPQLPGDEKAHESMKHGK